MRYTRRGLLPVAAASTAAAALAGCGGLRPAQPTGPGAPAAPAAIAVWYNGSPPVTAVPAYEKLASEFRTKQPNTRVSLEPLAGNTTDQEEKILTAAAGGAPPDVTYVHPIFNATLAVKTITVSLDPLLAKSKGTFDLQDFYPGAIDYFRWDGKLWSLPNYSGPGVYYYNRDLLQGRGLADPWEVYPRGQWTIQTMDDYVAKLTGGEGPGRVFGRDDLSRSIRVQSPWIQGFGGEVWNAKVTETLINGDGAVKAWEYLAGQLLKGYAPGPDALQGVSGGASGLFNAGRLAFTFGIRSSVPGFKVPLGMVPLHTMPDGKSYNRDGPNGLSLTRGGQAQDAAWQFLTFAVSRGTEINIGAGLTAPTTRSLAKSPLWQGQLLPGEDARAYDVAANQVKALVHPPRLSEIDKLIQDAYARVATGQATARAAMTEIKPQVDAILTSRSG